MRPDALASTASPGLADDISWRSVRSATEQALAGCPILFELVDLENRAGLDVGNDFRVYRLPTS